MKSSLISHAIEIDLFQTVNDDKYKVVIEDVLRNMSTGLSPINKKPVTIWNPIKLMSLVERFFNQFVSYF